MLKRSINILINNRNHWNISISSLGLSRIKCKMHNKTKHVIKLLYLLFAQRSIKLWENKLNFVISGDDSSVDIGLVKSHYYNLDEKQTQNEMSRFSKSYLNWNSFRNKIQKVIATSDRLSYTEST